jgi:hypothetical protein
MSRTTQEKTMNRTTITLFVALAALGIAGCGGRPGQVSGTVSFRGRPLAAGTVLLLASDGRPYDGTIGPDGGFVIKDVPTGDAQVAVTSLAPAGAERPSWAGALLPAANSRVGALAGTASAIPPRYGDLGQSGLTVAVGEDTRLDLDLQ